MTEKKETGFVNVVNDASKMKVICKGQPDRMVDLTEKTAEAEEKNAPAGKSTDKDKKGGINNNENKT